MYNLDFTPVFIFLIVVGMAIVGLIWAIASFFTSDDIRSDKPIKPRIELVIKDNTVDTIYVYKRP